ncbi:MAG: galactitol-1-phosphate 5-dehydrogenase [Bacteroides sp.]|nr:galactitol-1-phosphate 5-dehydrogenase [Alistipes timonensis]MCM1310981.1 galactitol-1-phosphate 5-dehydrogenase [Bacteroides sp.]MCM1405148.1 galactitol-1-phosphate 5-dehydrogenase [[Clostridium] fimetarium]
MKANVLYGINDLRVVRDYEVPKLKPGEVLVKVGYAGICGSDVARVFKTGTYHFPTVIGHEFSGTVVDVKAGVDSKWIGKRVGVFPLKPCFECPSCKAGSYETCDSYDYLGSRCDGGFEEFVAVPEWNLLELPDSVGLDVAAMLEPVSVAIHALNRVQTVKGKTVAIIGPGTIGNIVAKVAKCRGASKIIMIGRTQAKLDFALSESADVIINSKTQNVAEEVRRCTEGLGADIVVEGTGASQSLSIALGIANKGCDVILMGNPIEDFSLEKNVYWTILRKQLSLYGTWNSSFKAMKDDWIEALRLIESGQLNLAPLISHRLAFDQLLDGLKIMENRDILSNKVILKINE